MTWGASYIVFCLNSSTEHHCQNIISTTASWRCFTLDIKPSTYIAKKYVIELMSFESHQNTIIGNILMENYYTIFYNQTHQSYDDEDATPSLVGFDKNSGHSLYRRQMVN